MLSYRGITIHKPTGLYRVVAKVKGVWTAIGLYPSLKEAKEVYFEKSK